MTVDTMTSISPLDCPGGESEHIPMSSRGLDWAGLKFERRESRRGCRDLRQGSRHHLIFVGLSNGRVTRESNGERVEHRLTPGCVLVIPAGTPVRWTWSSRIGYCVLLLEPDVLNRVAHEVFGLQADQYRLPVAERRNDTAIANISGVLAREALSRDRAGSLYAQSLANILSVHLLRNYARSISGDELKATFAADEDAEKAASRMPVAPRAVADALQFIRRNYVRNVGLRDIAAAANVSPFYLARLFKQTLGVSPHQHVIELRVHNARSLLAAGSGERSLADVAAAVGFSDQSHLTRHFKRITGVTPSQFRG